MTTEEIQSHIHEAVRSNFDGFTAESMEMMTSEGGDGRFLGKVVAIRYLALPPAPEIYLAIGTTHKGVQIVKFGNSECLSPQAGDLDFLLMKELGLERPGGEACRTLDFPTDRASAGETGGAGENPGERL